MSVSTDTSINIGLGDIYVTREPGAVLACYGLGSCIAVSAYDPVARIGAMAHIVLPASHNGGASQMPAKYANTGIPMLIEMMEKAGAQRSRLIIKIAGGAKMLRGVQAGSVLDIGDRNIKAVSEALQLLGLAVQAQDIGGNWGRCLWLYLPDGQTQVRTADQRVVDL